MRGILERAGHRLAYAGNTAEAWHCLRENVVIDLVITELKLAQDSGMEFIYSLRRDPILKQIPVVIYASTSNRDLVHRAQELKVQNFMVKPYQEEALLVEVAKAVANPWRALHFEEERSFCAQMGITPTEMRRQLDVLQTELGTVQQEVAAWAKIHAAPKVTARLGEVIENAEIVGAWGVVECLTELKASVEEASWTDYDAVRTHLEFARKLIFYFQHADIVPTGLLTEDQVRLRNEEQLRQHWQTALSQDRCPLMTPAQLSRELDQLRGAPVMETVAAAFQMLVADNPTSLTPLMDLVGNDPGLSAELLIMANSAHVRDVDEKRIEDARMAVSLVGEQRLIGVSRDLVTIEERWMNDTAATGWTEYAKFQRGTAHMAQFICRFLDFRSLEDRACTAALIHDLGKLLLVRLHPVGFQTIRSLSLKNKIAHRTAERLFLDWTTPEMAAYFGTKRGLPQSYCNVLRWWDTPDAATEDQELVGIVALARELCARNRLGHHGEFIAHPLLPFEQTPVWHVMRDKTYFGFNLKKFLEAAQESCVNFRTDREPSPERILL